MEQSHDPYHARGLRGNPFVVEESTEIPAALWLDRGASRAPAPGKKRFMQVIGDPGVGKTSHLMHWRTQQPGPYRHYPPGLFRFWPPPIAPIAYWDEADRIPAFLLRQALRRAARQRATIVIGTHVDLTVLAEKYGFQTESVAPEPISSEELIAWSVKRIKYAQIDEADPPNLVLDRESSARIVAAAGNSWRVAADLLHIWAAEEVSRTPET